MSRKKQGRYRREVFQIKSESPRVWRLKDQGNSIVLYDDNLLNELGININTAKRFKDHRCQRRFHSIHSRNLKILIKKYLDALGLEIRIESKDENDFLKVISSNKIGAIPILSLKNHKPMCGIYVEPNLSWEGFGDVCSLIGWPLVPTIIDEDEKVPGGNKSVPPWLLAGPIIRSFYKALERPGRNYTKREEALSLVKGSINFEKYIENNLASGEWQKIPCEYDDLSLDCKYHQYVLAIVDHLLNDLQEVKQFSTSKDLIVMGKIIKKKLGNTKPIFPRLIDIERLHFRGVWNKYKKGFDYSKWLLAQKGLGGPDAGEGLPWAICSEELYELWVGYVVKQWSNSIGALMKASFNKSSILPVDWDIPYEKRCHTFFQILHVRRKMRYGFLMPNTRIFWKT